MPMAVFMDSLRLVVMVCWSAERWGRGQHLQLAQLFHQDEPQRLGIAVGELKNLHVGVRAGAQRRIDGMARQHGVRQQENPDGLRCAAHRSPVRLPANGWSLAPSTRLLPPHPAAAAPGRPLARAGASPPTGARHMGQCQLGPAALLGGGGQGAGATQLGQCVRANLGGEVQDRDGVRKLMERSEAGRFCTQSMKNEQTVVF